MELDRRRRRILLYLGALLGLIAVYTLLYDFGMSHLEGRDRTLLHSLRVVVESFTTTGYGSDAPWRHPVMNVLVVAMMFSGLIGIFAALPLFVVPAIQEAMETRPPSRADPDLSGHVVVCEFSPHSASLLEELESRSIEHVVLTSDEETANALHEEGESVVFHSPESTDGLAAANVDSARAVVVDAEEERAPSVVLTVRELAPDVPVVSLASDPDAAPYHRYAGATDVVTPERALGRSLADKLATTVAVALHDAVDLNGEFEIAELSVGRGSEICYTTLAESGIRERTGATLVGVWEGGEFEAPPSPDTRFAEGSVLLAAGTQDQLERLGELTRSSGRGRGRGPVVVVGGGATVRSAIRDALATADIQPTVVDRESGPAIDVVGDPTDERTLSEAGVTDARAVVIALESDVEAVYATLVARELAPDVQVVARATDDESVSKLYRAGADHVLSLSTVSGRMLASSILEEDVVSLNTNVEVVRTPAPELVGRTVGASRIRERTGCTVLAIERDGRTITDVGPDVEIRAGDELVVAGPDADVGHFAALANPDSTGE